MGKLYIAANEVAFGVGHLQFVYEVNGVFVELEVQVPDRAGGMTGGDWDFVGENGERAHFGDNTPGTNVDENGVVTIPDPNEYAMMEVATGRAIA